jgi:viroplasmin and RNaseH domain-containing protein
MVDTTLDNVFNGLMIRNHRYFYTRKGFEMMQGSEKDWFYVITCGRVPGIYTHW